MVAMGVGALFILLFSKAPWPQTQWQWWGTLALLSVLMAYVSGILFVLAGILSSVRFLLHPGSGWSEPTVESFDEELGLMTRLAHDYERRDLEYALDRITLLATQIRSRIALVIGALDKVGVIPLAIGAYFSVRRLLREQPSTPSDLSWMWGVAIGLGFLYVAGLSLLEWAQDLDDACLVLKHAVQAKQSDAPPELADAKQGATAEV
jgi:hypothetical protein